MATTPRTGLPEFWCTGVAKVLIGENPCFLSPWMAGHFKLEKRRRDEAGMAVWKANHTELLQKVIAEYRADGWKTTVEKFFKVTGQVAVLTGKVDLIVQKKDCRPKIVDAKSGAPRDSDVAQVLIEMIAIPMAWNAPGMQFDGEVRYPTHTVTIPHKDAAAMREKLFTVLRTLGSKDRPAANPGEHTCRFCDVAETDCPERWQDGAEVPAMTEEF